MIDFPEDIQEMIQLLRGRYKGKKSCVITAYPIIEVIKYQRHTKGSIREVSFKLFYQDKVFELQAPDHKYQSTLSHFDYSQSERRWVRNKNLLFATINDLRECGIWDLVVNKDMIIVNTANPFSDHKHLKKILKAFQ